MKVIILAAGYATRLYPLTLNCPKPLLKIAGKPMLDHILESLSPVEGIEEVIIVTNSKFSGHFREWASKTEFQKKKKKPRVIDDLTTEDTNKRGAIGDIYYVLHECGIREDIWVLAGDNLFENDLLDFARSCREIEAPRVGIYDVEDLELVKKYCSIEVDEKNRITSFKEKPQNPTSTWSAIALYYYPASVLKMIDDYIVQGNNPDQPGRLVEWLSKRIPFYVWKVMGKWYDIGSKESLKEADRIFTSLR